MQKLKKFPLDILIISTWTVLMLVFVLIPAFSGTFLTTLMNIPIMLFIPGALADTWFTLNHNETWEKDITFVPDREGEDIKLELFLYKEDNFPVPYQVLNPLVSIAK